MAVIFFDGFDGNRTEADESLQYWAYPYRTGHWSFYNAWVKGDNTGAARAVEFHNIDFNSGEESPGFITLNNVGVHSNKKVYFGARVGFDADVYPYETFYPGIQGVPFVVFYDNTGSSVSLKWDPAAVPPPDVGISVYHGNSGTPAATFKLTNAALASANEAALMEQRGPSDTWYLTSRLSTIGYGPAYPFGSVYEFELDLVNNTLSMWYQDLPFATLTESAYAPLNISSLTALSVHAAVDRFAPSSGFLTEMYLSDDTEPGVITRLGRTFRVLPSEFSSEPPITDGWNAAGAETMGGCLNPQPDSQFNAYANPPVNTSGFGDFDATYISTYDVGRYATGKFVFNSNTFSASVVGLSLDGVVAAEKDSAFKYVYRSNNINYDISNKITVPAGPYQKVAPVFVSVNPATGSPFIFPDIAGNVSATASSFGVRSVSVNS